MLRFNVISLWCTSEVLRNRFLSNELLRNYSFTIHAVFYGEFKTLEFSCHSVVKCEFFFFPFFFAISVIDQTPFFDSTLNLTNSTARIFTIKSSIGINFVGKGKSVVATVTLSKFKYGPYMA